MALMHLFNWFKRFFQKEKEIEWQSKELDEKEKYGNYSKPSLLEKMEVVEREKGYYWPNIGFELGSSQHYGCTPLDAIVFATTGGAGHHFAFLTDFGRIESLDEAPIVSIAPTNDPQVRLVASNLKEFVSLACTCGEVEVLDGWYDTYEEMKKDINDKYEPSRFDVFKNPYSKEEILQDQLELKELKARTDEMISDARKRFQLTSINDPVEFLKTLNQQRKTTINIPSENGIGVKWNQKLGHIIPLDYQSPLAPQLANSSFAQRLMLYRDCTEVYNLWDRDPGNPRTEIIESLKMDGFVVQSRILEYEM